MTTFVRETQNGYFIHSLCINLYMMREKNKELLILLDIPWVS